MKRALAFLAIATAALSLALTALLWWLTAPDFPTEESTLDEKQ